MLIHNKDDIEFVTEFQVYWDTLYVSMFLIFKTVYFQLWFHYKSDLRISIYTAGKHIIERIKKHFKNLGKTTVSPTLLIR